MCGKYSQKSSFAFSILEFSMDLFALFIGIVIGLIVGFALAWVWSSLAAKAKKTVEESVEKELKGLLAQQAKNHLDVSRESIRTLEAELSRLLTSVKDYEQSLSVTTEDYSKNTFFGEHASMFLRNNEIKPQKTISVKSNDDQPRDFANSGSGVFVGTPAVQSVKTKVKSTK
jgi:hypothetical protein